LFGVISALSLAFVDRRVAIGAGLGAGARCLRQLPATRLGVVLHRNETLSFMARYSQ
jgi:hypothetical protein